MATPCPKSSPCGSNTSFVLCAAAVCFVGRVVCSECVVCASRYRSTAHCPFCWQLLRHGCCVAAAAAVALLPRASDLVCWLLLLLLLPWMREPEPRTKAFSATPLLPSRTPRPLQRFSGITRCRPRHLAAAEHREHSACDDRASSISTDSLPFSRSQSEQFAIGKLAQALYLKSQ